MQMWDKTVKQQVHPKRDLAGRVEQKEDSKLEGALGGRLAGLLEEKKR
jgi:hypothetical protein